MAVGLRRPAGREHGRTGDRRSRRPVGRRPGGRGRTPADPGPGTALGRPGARRPEGAAAWPEDARAEGQARVRLRARPQRLLSDHRPARTSRARALERRARCLSGPRGVSGPGPRPLPARAGAGSWPRRLLARPDRTRRDRRDSRHGGRSRSPGHQRSAAVSASTSSIATASPGPSESRTTLPVSRRTARAWPGSLRESLPAPRSCPSGSWAGSRPTTARGPCSAVATSSWQGSSGPSTPTDPAIAATRPRSLSPRSPSRMPPSRTARRRAPLRGPVGWERSWSRRPETTAGVAGRASAASRPRVAPPPR